MSKLYKCIHCGTSTDELLCDGREREGSISLDTIELKLCDHCGKHVDFYLEYDVIIVILDMVLMKIEAYRHILYNTNFEKHWRVALLIILMQGFFSWWTKCNTTDMFNTDVIYYNESVYGTFLIQMAFFSLLALAESTSFMVCIITMLYLYWMLWPAKQPAGFTKIALWKGIVLGSFQQFFLVVPIIWKLFNSELVVLSIQTFHFLSITLAFSVICYTSWATSAAIVGIGLVSKNVLRHIVESSMLGLDSSCDPADRCATLTS